MSPIERIIEWYRDVDKLFLWIIVGTVTFVAVIVLCVVMAITSMNQFQRDCEAAGGYVKSTQTGTTVIVQPKGGVVIVPQYDYDCITR